MQKGKVNIMEKHFDRPTQVRFYDRDNERWIGGIAYGDEIICGECGGIEEIADFAEGEIVVYQGDWVDISESIMGDDQPC